MIDFYAEALKMKEAIINDLMELISIASVKKEPETEAPFGVDIKKALDYMLDIANKDGFITKNVDGYAGHIEYGEGEELFGVLGHLDVVPAGNHWSFDPFGKLNDGEYIYGRGTQDDKGPTLAAYYALKIIRNLELKTNKTIRLILGCDEESSWQCVNHYFSKERVPDLGFTPDSSFPVVYGEKGSVTLKLTLPLEDDLIVSVDAGNRPNMVIDYAKIELKGRYNFKEQFDNYLLENELTGTLSYEDEITVVSINGVSSHGARPEKGKNAFLYLVNFLNLVVGNQTFKWINRYLFNQHQGVALDINTKHDEMGDLTVNLGMVFLEKDNLSLIINIRYPIGITSDTINGKILQKARLLTEDVNIVLNGVLEPLYVDPNGELVQSLYEAYITYSDDRCHEPFCIGGTTYAKAIPNCVAFGAVFPDGTPAMAHQKDEKIKIEELLKAVAIYAHAIYELTK